MRLLSHTDILDVYRDNILTHGDMVRSGTEGITSLSYLTKVQGLICVGINALRYDLQLTLEVMLNLIPIDVFIGYAAVMKWLSSHGNSSVLAAD